MWRVNIILNKLFFSSDQNWNRLSFLRWGLSTIQSEFSLPVQNPVSDRTFTSYISVYINVQVLKETVAHKNSYSTQKANVPPKCPKCDA